MSKKVLLIGGGGHCKSCIDVLHRSNIPIFGIVDNQLEKGTLVLGVPVVGSDADLPKLRQDVNQCLITVGQIKTGSIRQRLFNLAKKLDFDMPAIISDRAYVADSAQIANGTIVMHDACVNANVTIGENSIINTKALVEHDCYVGENSHISTASILNGNVSVGANSFVGSGTIVSNGVNICEDVVVGAASLVRKDITHADTYFGNPLIGKINEK